MMCAMVSDQRGAAPRDATDSGFYVRHLDAISALERVKGSKRRTIELLGAAPAGRAWHFGAGRRSAAGGRAEMGLVDA
jgi:hypothetical protein